MQGVFYKKGVDNYSVFDTICAWRDSWDRAVNNRRVASGVESTLKTRKGSVGFETRNRHLIYPKRASGTPVTIMAANRKITPCLLCKKDVK